MRICLLAFLLLSSGCALPGVWKPNYGLPYSEPTTWPYCVTEVVDHWVSYPAQRRRNPDLVCGPNHSTVPRGLELLGAYSFDRTREASAGRVRLVLSAQSLERADLASFQAERLADLLRNPALTATYTPWQESREVEVVSRSETVLVRGRRWNHVVVSKREDPGNIWVEDFITPLDGTVVLVLRARYALDVPLVRAKLDKRQALTRSILEGIDVVALR
jgi:hypothetical protein